MLKRHNHANYRNSHYRRLCHNNNNNNNNSTGNGNGNRNGNNNDNDNNNDVEDNVSLNSRFIIKIKIK